MSMITVNAEGYPVMPRMNKPNDEQRSVVILARRTLMNRCTQKNIEAARTLLQLYIPDEMLTDAVKG
ncbi:hypothetical protein WJ64_30500 [Burkholderia ubonensis]|nr:hypothetical protein WJ64_30500 [Burkholderia ubonensis]